MRQLLRGLTLRTGCILVEGMATLEITVTHKDRRTSSLSGLPAELIKERLLTYKAIQDSQADIDSFIRHIGKGEEQSWTATDLDTAAAELVGTCRFCDIDPNCGCLELPFQASWNALIGNVELWLKTEEIPVPSLIFTFTKDFENWAKPYSLKDFAEAISAAAEGVDGMTYLLSGDLVNSGFELACAVRCPDNVISDEIHYWQEIVRSICSKAESNLYKRIQKDSLVTFFDFPPTIRSSCQQYLIYFIQFLEDLGIKADSEIKEEAGRVLFSVTPRDGPSALGQIREALDAYLQLPHDPQFSRTAEQFPDLAVTQLKSNVLFLQSQLELAKATIQAKDAAIQVLNFIAFQQKQFLTERAGKQHVEADQEPILGDTVHITTLEGKGFRINLPKILRRLKRALGISQPNTGGIHKLPAGPEQN